MDFSLTEEQLILRGMLRAFAREQVAPGAAERDRTHAFPGDLLRRMADLGLLGMLVPEEQGGSGLGTQAYSLALTELGAACSGTAVTVSVSNMVARTVLRHGSPEQRQRWLPGLCDGTLAPGAFALSEPGCGSDPASLRTRATLLPDGAYRLTGEKVFCTSASFAGLFLILARTGGVPGARGISAFLVGRDAPGLSVTRIEDKMGQRASNTASVQLDDCPVAAAGRLGPEGAGFGIALGALDGGRIGIASIALGLGQAALEAALRYSRERQAFGVPLAEHQAIQFKLADVATELEAAQLLTWRAAWLEEQGERPYTREAAMAKLFASEAAGRACDEALQIFGGYGYSRDYPVERYYRDVRVTRLYEGTSEIQRLVIARETLRALAAGALG